VLRFSEASESVQDFFGRTCAVEADFSISNEKGEVREVAEMGELLEKGSFSSEAEIGEVGGRLGGVEELRVEWRITFTRGEAWSLANSLLNHERFSLPR
jgi:hypothetical protein